MITQNSALVTVDSNINATAEVDENPVNPELNPVNGSEDANSRNIYFNYSATLELKPFSISENHWKEWVEGSRIDPAIAVLNLQSLKPAQVREALRWKGLPRKGGWKVQSSASEFFIVKPDEPMMDSSTGKPRKYETPKRESVAQDVLLLEMPDPDYWDKVRNSYETVYIVEGAKKAAAMLSLGYPTVALPGVWGFGTKRDSSNFKSKLGKARDLHPGLKALTKSGRRFVVLFDADIADNQMIRLAARDLGQSLTERGSACFIANIPESCQAKGIDDVLVQYGAEAVGEITKSVQEFTEWLEFHFSEQEKCPPHSEAAETLRKHLEGRVVYLPSSDCFYSYNDLTGCWMPVTTVEMRKFVSDIIKSYVYTGGVTAPYINHVMDLLKGELNDKDWGTSEGLKNFTNGVLDVKTMDLLPHSSDLHILDIPDIAYSKDSVCPVFDEFLSFALRENSDAIKFLWAYIRAIITRSYNLQSFLELDGEGGTGKSVLMEVLNMIAGERNTGETSLPRLEGGKFEMYNLIDKALILIRDSDKFQGDSPILKSLTGNDKIPLEAKYKQSDGVGRRFEGMVVIASNYPIKFASDSSAIFRRRRIIKFDRIVRKERREDLNIVDKLKKELPGIINKALRMSAEEMELVIKHPKQHAPTVYNWSRAQLVDTDPLAAWADECLVLDADARLQVGNAESTGVNQWAYSDSRAFPNYVKFCADRGYKHVAVNKFTTTLFSQVVKQLELPVTAGKTNGRSIIKGLRLRNDLDRCPNLISGEEWEDKTGESLQPEFTPETAEYSEACLSEIIHEGDSENLTPEEIQAEDVATVAMKLLQTSNQEEVQRFADMLEKAASKKSVIQCEKILGHIVKVLTPAKLEAVFALLKDEDKAFVRTIAQKQKIQVSI